MKRLAPLLAVPLVLATLAGCGKGAAREDVAALDRKLLGASAGNGTEANAADPALMSALEDQIMVDPALTQQSNHAAARPADTPGSAPIPVTDVPLPDKGAVARSTEDYSSKVRRGDLLRAPAPVKAAANCRGCSHDSAVSLGQLRDVQQGRVTSGSCARKFDYSLGWVKRMPIGMPLYPDARLTEAAGLDSPACRIRAATYVTTANSEVVLDWYYTKMVRSGFNVEHQVRNGNHVLAGVRETDDSAWYLIFNDTAAGGTEIDIIANNGQ